MFGKRAVELINEIANCSPENLPAYNVRNCTCSLWSRTRHQMVACSRHTHIAAEAALWLVQEEHVRLVIEEINEHYNQMSDLVRYELQPSSPVTNLKLHWEQSSNQQTKRGSICPAVRISWQS